MQWKASSRACEFEAGIRAQHGQSDGICATSTFALFSLYGAKGVKPWGRTKVQKCRRAAVRLRCSRMLPRCASAGPALPQVLSAAVLRGAAAMRPSSVRPEQAFQAAFPTLAGLSVIAGKVNGPERLPSIEQSAGACSDRDTSISQDASLTREPRTTCEPLPQPSRAQTVRGKSARRQTLPPREQDGTVRGCTRQRSHATRPARHARSAATSLRVCESRLLCPRFGGADRPRRALVIALPALALLMTPAVVTRAGPHEGAARHRHRHRHRRCVGARAADRVTQRGPGGRHHHRWRHGRPREGGVQAAARDRPRRGARRRRTPTRHFPAAWTTSSPGPRSSPPSSPSPNPPPTSSSTRCARIPAKSRSSPSGPLQNVADAIRKEPNLGTLAKRVVLMSGSIGGNAWSPSPVPEWNVVRSTADAQLVYSTPVDDDRAARLDHLRHAEARGAGPAADRTTRRSRARSRRCIGSGSNDQSTRMTLHDQMAVAETLRPGAFFGHCESMPIRVDEKRLHARGHGGRQDRRRSAWSRSATSS